LNETEKEEGKRGEEKKKNKERGRLGSYSVSLSDSLSLSLSLSLSVFRTNKKNKERVTKNKREECTEHKSIPIGSKLESILHNQNPLFASLDNHL